MEDFWTFVTSWTFMAILIAVLVVLIGIFVFMRSRKTDD